MQFVYCIFPVILVEEVEKKLAAIVIAFVKSEGRICLLHIDMVWLVAL